MLVLGPRKSAPRQRQALGAEAGLLDELRLECLLQCLLDGGRDLEIGAQRLDKLKPPGRSGGSTNGSHRVAGVEWVGGSDHAAHIAL